MSYPVPYICPLPSSLHDGHEILIDFTMHGDAKRATVSICQGTDFSHTTPLTFDIRFNQNEVIRNHFHGNWGPEEKHGGFPFQKGGRYEIRIVVRSQDYQVFVNKQHFCDFKHRVGKEEARNLRVDGDITIHKVVAPNAAHSNLDVPLTIPLSDVRPGRKIKITCTPLGGQRFSVNLLAGPTIDHDDVVLHVDARFSFGSCKNVVVRNSKIGGKWGQEETKEDSFPFSPNKESEIVIKAKENAFKIIVDDEDFAVFPYRIQPQAVKYLNITGDVKVNHIKL